MERVQHPSNNEVLGAPTGWRQSELPCGALPITRTDVDGKPAIISFWRPTAEELAQLNAGGTIALWVLRNAMPPISLCIDAA